jgi:pimeloyl-[acyl-carrier protein] methyl ester esterase
MRLILLPGLDGTGALMAPLAAALRVGHGVEVVSYPPNLTRYDEIARWLAPQLSGRDYALIAESFSGPLAIAIAEERPEDLKAVILIASFACSPRRLPAFLARALYLLPLRSLTLMRVTQRFLVGRWGETTFPEDFVKVLREIPRLTLVDRMRAVARVDVSDRLSEIPGPKLLIVGSADRLVPRSQSAMFATAGWTVEGIEGPHFLALTRPADVAEQIERFLCGQGGEDSDNRP